MEFNSGWYMYSFFGNTGLELGLNDDGVTNYCTWNSTDNSIKGADVVNRMMELTSSPAFVNRADGDLPAALASGKVIAAISGVWNSTTSKRRSAPTTAHVSSPPIRSRESRCRWRRSPASK